MTHPAYAPETTPVDLPGAGPAVPVLQARDLRTVIARGQDRHPAIDGITFDVNPGEIVALVGESGSGKSLTALSVLRLLKGAVQNDGGTVTVGGRDLLGLSAKEMRAVRGSEIGMIFQDPMTALNPFQTIETQVAETLRLHGEWSKAALRERILTLLTEVGIVNPPMRMKQYPYELSGGTQQRVMIAMALANEPKLLIADEPTTGLDATVQAQIMVLIKRLAADHGTGVLIITHDLGLVSGISDRTIVMYAGEVVESGPTAAVLSSCRHPYTRALIEATPRVEGGAERLTAIPGSPPELHPRPTGCRFHPRCALAQDACRTDHPHLQSRAEDAVDEFRCWFPVEDAPLGGLRIVQEDETNTGIDEDAPVLEELAEVARHRTGTALRATDLRRDFKVGRRAVTHAVAGVSLEVPFGETLGIVGESGCGKSTLARLLAGLDQPTSGTIERDESESATSGREARLDFHRYAQFVFQDTFGSLDPRRTVLQSVSEPLQNLTELSTSDRRRTALQYMKLCGLPASMAGRYPHELSGGQRQRVGIARALVVEPAVVVMDEPMSGLDVSVQAQIVNLLQDLREEAGLTAVLVSHDVGVVRHLSDRVAVMYLGRVVEEGPADEVLSDPQHPYTAALVSAVPLHDPEEEAKRVPILLKGDVGDVSSAGTGCAFAARCPVAQDVCTTAEPALVPLGETATRAACHFPGSLTTAIQEIA